MASIFSITTATNNIPIGTKRKATILFTVTNTSSRSLTGRAGLVMDPPHGAHWLEFKTPEEIERHFEVNSVQEYIVNVNVPVDALAGEYIFHLDMVDVDNTDETYTPGPTVKLQVAAPEKKEEKKPFPWWIIAVAVGVLAVIGLILFLVFRPRPIAVPDVIGQPQTEAQETVTAVGLAFEKTAEKSSEQTVGIVLATTPQAFARVGKATPVFYVLSAPPIDLPGTPVRDRVFGLLGQSVERIYGGACSSGFVRSSFRVIVDIRQRGTEVGSQWEDLNNNKLCAIRVNYRFSLISSENFIDAMIIIKQVSE